MATYRVSLERNGEMILIGTIQGNRDSDMAFRYRQEYLDDPTAIPISQSLPLRKEEYEPETTRIFFDGMLPEGFTRQQIRKWIHGEEGGYIDVLNYLGRECLGGLQVLQEGEPVPVPGYERISDEKVKELAEEGASASTEIIAKTHLSLSGASGKVGLFYDSAENQWYLPYGTAPSTHIVKQSHVRYDGIVANELMSLRTAQLCGIPVPNSSIIRRGGREDDSVLLASQRYDRVYSVGTEKIISGKRAPNRLHQEDFAQALGISAADKYEKQPRGYLSAMFDLLRRISADPIRDQRLLWEMIVFDYLIGNTDAHLKNFSLLYTPDQKKIRLAPAYDIVGTVVYEESTREMSLYIGDHNSLDDITEEDFARAAKDCGLGVKSAMKRMEDLRERFVPALKKAASELEKEQYPGVERRMEEILRHGGIRTLL